MIMMMMMILNWVWVSEYSALAFFLTNVLLPTSLLYKLMRSKVEFYCKMWGEFRDIRIMLLCSLYLLAKYAYKIIINHVRYMDLFVTYFRVISYSKSVVLCLCSAFYKNSSIYRHWNVLHISLFIFLFLFKLFSLALTGFFFLLFQHMMLQYFINSWMIPWICVSLANRCYKKLYFAQYSKNI